MITGTDGLHTKRGNGSTKDQTVKNYTVICKVNVIPLTSVFSVNE